MLMKQMSPFTEGFKLAHKRTRKREFLDEMNLVVPWTELVCLIEPHTLRSTKWPTFLCCVDHAAHPLHAAVV